MTPTHLAEPVRNRDPHSYAELDTFRVRHIDLRLEVAFAQRQVHGEAILRFDKLGGGSDSLILDTRDLTIHAVEGSERGESFSPRPYEVGPGSPLLGSPLTIQPAPHDRLARICYSTGPNATALQWLDPAQAGSRSHPFLFTQSQEIHTRSWIPTQDTPAARVTFSARVITPPNLRAVMGASHNRESRRTGEYTFEMRQPIPCYLIALAVGDLDFSPIGARTGVYADPSVLPRAVNEFGDIEQFLQTAERLYGRYRWGRFDILVLPPSFPFGGMEIPQVCFVTPTLIAGDKSLVSLTAHELAHSWSGNLVTNATWSDFWLNEGFTTYIEGRIVEAVYGLRRAEIEQALQRKRLDEELARLAPRDQVLCIDLENRDPDDGSTLVPYEKGALFLKTLEERFGRPRFDAFLRDYFHHFAFRSITTAEALEYIQEHLLGGNADLAGALDIHAWVYEPGLPPSAPDARSPLLGSIDEKAALWAAGSLSLAGTELIAASPLELLHFLESLPRDLPERKMEELDRYFGLTASHNSEILQRWLLMAVRNGYQPAYPAVDQFLLSVGRRKYVKPLYEELAKSAEGLSLARAIYAQARAAYHPITQASIDAILSPGA